MEKAVVTGGVLASKGTLGDILKELAVLEKDWQIIVQVLAIWSAANSLPVGGTQSVPDIHVDLGTKRFDWAAGTITRTS